MSERKTITLAELRRQGEDAAKRLTQAGFTSSDPEARLCRKEALGKDVSVEREALKTRGKQ